MDEKEFNRLLKNIRVNEGCFRRLYEYYVPKIVYYFTEYYRDKELGRDVAQEFFQSLLVKANLPAYVKFPMIWVLRRCEDIAAQMAREGRTDGRVSLEKASKSAVFMPRLDPEPTDSWALLGVLDETTARIIVMCVCEGYGLNEIAEMLGMNYDAVRQRYSRGLKLMRDVGRARNGEEDDPV